jgi:membrane-bound lytic murein transglycosylase D
MLLRQCNFGRWYLHWRSLLLIAVVAALSGCASMGNDWSSDTDSSGARNPRAAKAPRVDLSKQSVSSLMAPSSNLWLRIQDGFAMPELNSPLVIEQTRWLAARPDYVHRSMARSSRYLFYIVAEINVRNMPTEIALLPFVESAFNPVAKSTAKAMGIWQFMPATGKDFKLTQNVFRDERRDVLQSTNAALDYLERLHRQFGDWQLALAAYNWGEGNVAKAIKRNQAAGLPTDYLSLKMPKETREYVPKLMAYKAIVSDPSAYGIVLPELENHPYFVAIDVTRDIDVDLVIKLADITPDDFRNLNPSFNKPVILSAANQQILLPFGRAELFQENLRSYTQPLSTWTAVSVLTTESAEQLSKRLGVSVAVLREVNAIPLGMRVKVGSTVLIPKPSSKSADVSEHLAESASLSLVKPAPVKKAAAPTTASKKANPAPSKTAQNSTKPSVKTASKPPNQQKPVSTDASKSAKTTTAKASTGPQ